MQRRDSEYIVREMMRLLLRGKRPRGRPEGEERRFIDVAKEIHEVSIS